MIELRMSNSEFRNAMFLSQQKLRKPEAKLPWPMEYAPKEVSFTVVTEYDESGKIVAVDYPKEVVQEFEAPFEVGTSPLGRIFYQPPRCTNKYAGKRA